MAIDAVGTITCIGVDHIGYIRVGRIVSPGGVEIRIPLGAGVELIECLQGGYSGLAQYRWITQGIGRGGVGGYRVVSPVPAVRRCFGVLDHDGPALRLRILRDIHTGIVCEFDPEARIDAVHLLDDHGAVGERCRTIATQPVHNLRRVVQLHRRVGTIVVATADLAGIGSGKPPLLVVAPVQCRFVLLRTQKCLQALVVVVLGSQV